MKTLNSNNGPSNTKKLKSQIYDGVFWSEQGDKEIDPYSDLDLVIKSRSTAATTTKDGKDDVETTTKVHGLYHVHRCMLGRQSGFFDRLLRGGFAESDNSHAASSGDTRRQSIDIFLHPLAAEYFGYVLEYIYYGVTKDLLDMMALQEYIAVANISDYLGILPLYNAVNNLIVKRTTEYDNDDDEDAFICKMRKFAKKLGMEKIATQIIKGYFETEWWVIDDMFPSANLMKLCLDFADNNPGELKQPFTTSHPFISTIAMFFANTNVKLIPKNIYDRFLGQSTTWEPAEFVRAAIGLDPDRDAGSFHFSFPVNILILHEKFYPTANVTDPLTDWEKECVKAITSEIEGMDPEDKRLELKDLPKRILLHFV